MVKKTLYLPTLRLIAAKILCVCLLLPGVSAAPIGQQKDAEKQYNAARKRFEEWEYLKALQGAEEALKIDPAFAPAIFLKSQCLMELYARESRAADKKEARASLLKQIKEAAEITEEYLKQNPNLTYGHVWRDQLKSLQAYVRFSQPSKDPNSPNAVFSPREVPTKAKPLKQGEPQVTEEARRACANGTVVLRGVVDRDGTVQSLVVVESVGYGMTEECLKAARRTKCSPAQKDGKAVPQYIQLEYNFSFDC